MILATVSTVGVLADSPASSTLPSTLTQPGQTRSTADSDLSHTSYNIVQFKVLGSNLLDEPAIANTMREALGNNVTLPTILRALHGLQNAYRERGFADASVILPSQPLTNGVVQILVSGSRAESVPQVPAEPPRDPGYDIRHFIIQGNSLLEASEIDRILAPAAGSATGLDQIRNVLKELQRAYRDRGCRTATVSLPEQILTDGTILIQVDEGRAPQPLSAPISPSPTTEAIASIKPAPASPPAFEVRHYEVLGNTLLKATVVDQILTNATGSAVTLAQIQKALGELQLAYRERGFATVSIGLPQQQITNAVVRVQVTEGKLADIQIVGNKHFSTNNVKRALPSLQTNVLLNSRIFQRELDIANQNRDRQIYPTLGPGPEPGTSALTLRVKDRWPLHGRLELNNHSTPGTPEWRINASAQYNNLWQHEHQAGISYGFTPEAFKSDGAVRDVLFNRPLIANYGAYYRFPFGSVESVEEQIRGSTAFGYDEATRQFRLPPAGSRPDISFFASASSSDTGVQFGRDSIVSQTPLLTIVSRDGGQNITINESAGLRLNLPVAVQDNRRWSFSAGPDWKRYSLESFNTNNFVITTVVTNALGSQTIESRVASPQPARRNEVTYLPLSASVDYFQTDKTGSLAANLGVVGNFVGRREDFASAAHSRSANPNQARTTLSVTRDQKLPGDWSLQIRASGQAATGALLSNEQFAIGGLGSVRGYHEGDQYGDSGWFGGFELRTPLLSTSVPGWAESIPAWLRASVFMDYGQRFLLNATSGAATDSSLWGTGFGLSANLNNHLDLRITVGWPLLDSPNREAGEPRANFSIGGQF